MSLVIVRLCSLLLLLCERKLTTFSKDYTRYEYCSFQKNDLHSTRPFIQLPKKCNGNVTRLCSRIDLHNSHTFHRTFHTHAHTLVPQIRCVFKEQTSSNSFVAAEYSGGYRHVYTYHFVLCVLSYPTYE